MNTSNDEKVRMAAADKLLGYHKDVAESVNRDALQRAIANMRKGGGESPQESGKPIPTFDFDTVQVIEG